MNLLGCLGVTLLTILTLDCVALAAERPAESHNAGPMPARLPDGHPNWTGFWVPPRGMMESYRGPSGLSGLPQTGRVNSSNVDPTMPELKPPYKEELQALLMQVEKGPLPDKVALCYPQGMPGMMVMIYGMEILQTPKTVAITSDLYNTSRHIWLDAQHPAADELDPTYTGDSIAHWEGDTLVVDTVGLRPDVAFQHQIPLRHSPDTHIVERFHQTAPDLLEDDMTIIDNDMFVKPWSKVYRYHYRPDLRLEEYVCLDNNRNVDEQGRQKF